MLRWCYFLLLLSSISSCKNSGEKTALVFVEDFRSEGMTDDEVIQSAVSSASPGATIYFAPQKLYILQNGIAVKQFQTLVGNDATLKRANQSYTVLDTAAAATSDSLILDSIPRDWKVGDQLQIFLDTFSGNSNIFGDYPKLPNIITKMGHNKVVLSSPVGRSLDGRRKIWPKGSKVRKVFTMLRGDSIQFRSAPFRVVNMNFDGNKRYNSLSYYWNVNSTIFTKGLGAKIEDCRFYDIPAENIVGQGLYVSNCQAKNLNGSFVHFSGNDTIKGLPQRNSVISGNTVDGVCQVKTYLTGHSEAAFTTSYNGGYATIVNNRIYNCGEAAVGAISSSNSVADAGKSELLVQGNLFKNCKRIIADILAVAPNDEPSTDIYISGNIFSNCGENDLTRMKGYKDCPDIKIGENSLTNGTTLKY
jgi:hypothetical protein